MIASCISTYGYQPTKQWWTEMMYTLKSVRFIHSFILQPVLRKFHSLFQSQFSTQGDLERPLSISSPPSFPYDHLVAACIFFLVLTSLLSFPLPFFQ